MKEQEEQFRIVFEQASDGIFISDSIGRFIDVNRAGCKMLGYTKEEIIRLTVADILHQSEIERLYTGIEQLIKGEEKRERGRFRRKDQTIFIGEVSSRELSNGRLLAIVRDITEQVQEEEDIQKSEERFRVTLDHLLEGCMIIGFDWTYLYVNDSAARNGQNTRENLLGRTMLEMYPGVEKSTVFAHYKQCMEERIPQHFEEPFTFADGTTVWNRFSVEPVSEGIFILALDITQQKKDEEILRISEAKWRNLFEILPVGVSVVDSNRKIQEFNNALCQILELSPEELLSGKYNNRRYLNSDYTEFNFDELPSIRTIQKNEPIRDVEVCVEVEGGIRKWVSVNAAPIPYLNSSILATIDITGQKKAEAEIVKSREQLMQLYRHLNEVREEERSAIAREIHDELGQSLASLKLDLIGIKEDFEEQLKLKRKIDKAITLVDTSIKTVQKISSALRPQMLDELGLAAAIEWLSNDFKKRSGIKCSLDLQDIDYLEPNISISLFRIFQAALANIMLHSKAKSISVKLELRDEILLLSVKDDGIGITQEQINSSKSFGIVGMSERAEQINGSFEINSEINKGTEIKVTVPVTGKKNRYENSNS